MASKSLPSQDVLRQLLDYDPDTGALTWKARDASFFASAGGRKPSTVCATWNTRYAGTAAICSRDKQGYLCGALLNIPAKAHRVIWKWMTGEDPMQVDHCNGKTDDNRWANLRNVDQIGNARNAKLRANNHSGVHGVAWDKRAFKWIAQIGRDGTPVQLGRFDLFWDAVAARQKAEKEMGFHENHGRVD